MYIYIHTYIHQYIHTYMHTHTHTHTRIYIRTYLYIRMCTYIHTHMHAYTQIRTYLSAPWAPSFLSLPRKEALRYVRVICVYMHISPHLHMNVYSHEHLPTSCCFTRKTFLRECLRYVRLICVYMHVPLHAHMNTRTFLAFCYKKERFEGGVLHMCVYLCVCM